MVCGFCRWLGDGWNHSRVAVNLRSHETGGSTVGLYVFMAQHRVDHTNSFRHDKAEKAFRIGFVLRDTGDSMRVLRAAHNYVKRWQFFPPQLSTVLVGGRALIE